MKNMSLAVLAVLAAGCNHDAWHQTFDQTAQSAKEYEANFKNVVMGGQSIDENQTWNTGVTTQVSLHIAKTGTLKVYAQDPVGSNPAVLYSSPVSAGETRAFAVARPQGAETLYAVVADSRGYILDNIAFRATDEKVTAAFYTGESSQAPAFHGRRAIAPAFDFADAPLDEDFAEAIPAGAYPADQYYAHNSTINNYYLDEKTENVALNPWVGKAYYYVTGKHNLTFSNPGDGSVGVRYYILPGADVHFVGTYNYNCASNHAMYVSAGAKVTFDQGMTANVHIYNRGEIVVKGVTGPYANGLIFNEGTITSEKNLSVFNSGSQVVNAGTWNVAKGVTVEGSGHMLNLGTMNVADTTLVNSNNCTWVNDGQYFTGYYVYHAGSTDVINNCKLTVHETFYINLGDTDRNSFQMDGGSGVVTKNFHFDGPGFIVMGSNSVFEVQQTATMNITKDVYGIYGPKEGAPAVFTAKEIVNGAKDANQCFVANYFQQLVVATDKHFAQGYSDGTSDAAKANGGIGSQPYYHIGSGACLVENGVADTKIEATQCNPGFNGGGKKKEEVSQYIYFAFEDLGMSDDFDFNDVVVRVAAPDASGKAKVELCAVGGTLETYVYNGDDLLGDEVHTEFGWNYGTYVVDDKGNTNKDKIVTPFKEIGEVTVAADASVADLNINIHVRQNGVERVITRPAAGETPFRIAVTGDDEGKWFWAKERVNISEAHTAFGEWGANVNVTGWHLNPVVEKVVNW